MTYNGQDYFKLTKTTVHAMMIMLVVVVLWWCYDDDNDYD